MMISDKRKSTTPDYSAPAAATRQQRGGVEIAWAGAVAVAAVAIAWWLYGAPLSRPWNYGSDAVLQLMNVHTVLGTGFYGTDPSFGAPFGQDNQDFPRISSTGTEVWLIKALGVFASGVFTVTNAYL